MENFLFVAESIPRPIFGRVRLKRIFLGLRQRGSIGS